MNTIFNIVYSLLSKLSALTGFTYNEINIIVYYFITPLLFLILTDRIFRTHILKVFYAVSVISFLTYIEDFRAFSDFLFQKSVDFLSSFTFLGWSYTVSSVLICVVLPAVVFILMVDKAYPELFRAVRRAYEKRFL